MKLLKNQENLSGHRACFVVRDARRCRASHDEGLSEEQRRVSQISRQRWHATYPPKVVEKNPPGDSKKSEVPETFLRNWR